MFTLDHDPVDGSHLIVAGGELDLAATSELSAIFALNDPMAVGALAALRERGIAVPDQISVVGFDDIPLASDIMPALTTVRVPMIEMGARAMTLALEPSDAELRIEHLPTEVIVRASTGRIEN